MLAYQLVEKYNFTTVGVSAKQAYGYEVYDVDEIHVIDRKW